MAKKFFVPILQLPAGILNSVFTKDNCVRASEDECWMWLGPCSGGYGYISVPKEFGGKSIGAHRIAYAVSKPTLFRDDLPVRRMCEMRGCINPKHLFQRGMIGPYAGVKKYAKTKFTEAAVRTIKKWYKVSGSRSLAVIYHTTEKEIERLAKLR